MGLVKIDVRGIYKPERDDDDNGDGKPNGEDDYDHDGWPNRIDPPPPDEPDKDGNGRRDCEEDTDGDGKNNCDDCDDDDDGKTDGNDPRCQSPNDNPNTPQDEGECLDGNCDRDDESNIDRRLQSTLMISWADEASATQTGFPLCSPRPIE